MSLYLEEIKIKNEEENIGYILNFADECVSVFKSGIFSIDISFKDIDALQEQIDNNK